MLALTPLYAFGLYAVDVAVSIPSFPSIDVELIKTFPALVIRIRSDAVKLEFAVRLPLVLNVIMPSYPLTAEKLVELASVLQAPAP